MSLKLLIRKQNQYLLFISLTYSGLLVLRTDGKQSHSNDFAKAFRSKITLNNLFCFMNENLHLPK